MALMKNNQLIVFGELQKAPAEDVALEGRARRVINLLGETTQASVDELASFANLLLAKRDAISPSEVTVNLTIEADGRLALPLVAEGGLGVSGSISLKFKRSERS